VVPVLVVFVWYAKNYYYFGVFSASTMMGLGMANVATLTVPREQLWPLVDKGELSPFAVISRYAQVDLLFSSQHLEPWGIPVVDQVKKTTPGAYNYNNRQMVVINQYYARDALTVMRKFPLSYATGVFIANRLFFSPTSMNVYFTPENRDAVYPMERFYDPVVYGARQDPVLMRQPIFGFDKGGALEVNTSMRLVIVWFLVIGYGYVQARRIFLERKSPVDPRAVVMGFFVITAVYVQVVSTMLELAENYRYRFLVEPLFFVVTAAVLTEAMRWLRAALTHRAQIKMTPNA
jgi:hypothetical protein